VDNSVAVSGDASLSLRLVAVDFSYYEDVMGIGVAVYEGNLQDVLHQSLTLSQASHTFAEKCTSKTCVMKAIRVALYGLHRREFKLEEVYEFLDLLNGMGLKVSQLIATNYAHKIISSIIEQWTSNSAILLVHDTPGVHRYKKGRYIEREELIVQEIKMALKRKGLINTIVGKNYFITLSDIVSYLAALNRYLLGKEDKEVEEKKIRLVELLRPFNLIFL